MRLSVSSRSRLSTASEQGRNQDRCVTCCTSGPRRGSRKGSLRLVRAVRNAGSYSIRQTPIVLHIERVNTQSSPHQGFRPNAELIEQWVHRLVPIFGSTRIVTPDTESPIFYDSMLAKLIVFAPVFTKRGKMMRITRRRFTVGALAAGLFPLHALAQSYPSRDLHLICAFPPGSGADVIVRFFGERLRLLTKRTVIVDNKPGASGSIATEAIARAKPDGYTIMIHGGTALSANMHLGRPWRAKSRFRLSA
jgi:Tripartite tricarboxylate transporter family receptor